MVANLNHQVGARSFASLSEASQNLQWVELNVPTLLVVNIPGVDNWAVDFLSWETFDPGKWSRVGVPRCGPFHVASYKLLLYVSRASDLKALAVDDFVNLLANASWALLILGVVLTKPQLHLKESYGRKLKP